VFFLLFFFFLFFCGFCVCFFGVFYFCLWCVLFSDPQPTPPLFTSRCFLRLCATTSTSSLISPPPSSPFFPTHHFFFFCEDTRLLHTCHPTRTIPSGLYVHRSPLVTFVFFVGFFTSFSHTTPRGCPRGRPRFWMLKEILLSFPHASGPSSSFSSLNPSFL